MKIHKQLIKKLENKISNPKKGLPKDIFLFLSRISPLINVDLLIKEKKRGTILIWRKKGETYNAGWHVPGGIIRFRDSIKKRLNFVAKNELKSKIFDNYRMINIFEIKLNQKNRSHFISILYKCKLRSMPPSNLRYKSGKPLPGQWKWHKFAPKDLIYPHEIYKNYINN